MCYSTSSINPEFQTSERKTLAVEILGDEVIKHVIRTGIIAYKESLGESSNIEAEEGFVSNPKKTYDALDLMGRLLDICFIKHFS